MQPMSYWPWWSGSKFFYTGARLQWFFWGNAAKLLSTRTFEAQKDCAMICRYIPQQSSEMTIKSPWVREQTINLIILFSKNPSDWLWYFKMCFVSDTCCRPARVDIVVMMSVITVLKRKTSRTLQKCLDLWWFLIIDVSQTWSLHLGFHKGWPVGKSFGTFPLWVVAGVGTELDWCKVVLTSLVHLRVNSRHLKWRGGVIVKIVRVLLLILNYRNERRSYVATWTNCKDL